MSTRSPLRWPKHKQPLATDSSSPKLSFNALFGLRAKKPSSPEPRCTSPLTEASSIYGNRPPSKSVSSMRSPVDSLGPKTLSDLRESRQSLLTLSDHDPFAGGSITVHTPPRSTVGSNRLSTHSKNSLPEVIGGELETIALFPTTSSQERSLSPDSALFAGYSAPACRGPTLKKSPDPPYSRFVNALGTAFPTAPEKLTKSDSCTTLTNRPVTSAIPARSPMRPRGLTESAMTHRSRSAVASPGTPPRCISRQVSLARLGIPPSAPPSQQLPPPPTSPVPLDSNTSGTHSDTLPVKPSGSLFSTPSDTFSLCSTRRKCKLPDLVPTSPEKPSMATRKLKKAVSHNSIAKLSISISPLEPSPIRTDEDQEKYHVERPSCKQRSFQSRLPALPIITSSPSRSQSPTSGSNSSLTSRRRLFSATRRPSICQSNSTEEDAQSIFSLRSEQNIPLSPSRPWIGPSHSPSFGEDGASDEPSSPQLGNKYTPQHIMSPAAMAEVEASVEFIASPRSRGLSITTITSSKDKDDELSSPATSPALSPFSSSGGSSTLPSRSSSLLFKGSSSPPLRTVTRPSTSQSNTTSITNGQSSYQPSPSPPLSLMSLPPPPRPRQRTTTAPSSSKAPSDLRQLDDLRPLSRPPSSSVSTTEAPLRHETALPMFLRPPSKVSPDAQFHRDAGFRTTFLPPPSELSIDPQFHHDTSFQTFSQRPPRRNLLPKTSMEKFFRRRSLLRKPSFLEIDDEAPQETFDQCDSAASLGDSFLDLTRESFDMNTE
ncbi:hypothetical protein APHAL10511_006039 [Amanita phalloides]|nr:hypothetical protein APHAL10511_006039 [Amanita phalloides]